MNSEVVEKNSNCTDAFSLPGRQVVELGVLAKALDEGCKACNTPLRLSDCTDETISGLGSFLYIACQNAACGEINQCTTNKAHRTAGTTRGRKIFDVNTKIAADKSSSLGHLIQQKMVLKQSYLDLKKLFDAF